MKIKCIFILILLLTNFCTYLVGSYYTSERIELKALEKEFAIGKWFSIIIKNKDTVDYIAVNNGMFDFDYFTPDVRHKLSKFMKYRNLKIKTGEYKCNQGYSFEECLAFLDYEYIDSNK